MQSTRYPNVPIIVLIAAATALLSGCGVTLSPAKRKPLEVSPLQTSLRPVPGKILVRFESTLPGQPLCETVWDNASGPFQDAVESKQIGFTQNYSKLVAANLVGGAAASGVVATHPTYTRIVIPFGRLFEGVFESGLRKVFPESLVCSDAPDELEKLRTTKPRQLVRLAVKEFRVWEQPLNHINLSAMVECRVYRADTTEEPTYVFRVNRQITNQAIGTKLSTSSTFLREMNKVSNTFAGHLSEEILENLQKKLGD